jgi:hypothetical protein
MNIFKLWQSKLNNSGPWRLHSIGWFFAKISKCHISDTLPLPVAFTINIWQLSWVTPVLCMFSRSVIDNSKSINDDSSSIIDKWCSILCRHSLMTLEASFINYNHYRTPSQYHLILYRYKYHIRHCIRMLSWYHMRPIWSQFDLKLVLKMIKLVFILK